MQVKAVKKYSHVAIPNMKSIDETFSSRESVWPFKRTPVSASFATLFYVQHFKCKFQMKTYFALQVKEIVKY